MRRLRARRAEIEDAIFERVREVGSRSHLDEEIEYAEGLRATVAAAVDYGLRGMEHGSVVHVPREVVAQAQRAARGGVGLDAVLRRYMVGNALLWDFVVQEAAGIEELAGDEGLRGLLRAQSSLLDELVVVAAEAHTATRGQRVRSREQRAAELVRRLLAGEIGDAGGLGYDMALEHIGVIATGVGCRDVLMELATDLGRQLLCVASQREAVWGWLGGRRPLATSTLERALERLVAGMGSGGRGVPAISLAIGEPARGLEGWRLTHEQARAAQMVAARRPQRLTRYADVALLAAALRDRLLATSLLDVYLSPLEDSRDGGETLRGTLHAYLLADRNASCAASALNVARSTVENRLRAIEERLGYSLRTCPAELEIALRLHELGVRGGEIGDVTENLAPVSLLSRQDAQVGGVSHVTLR